MQKSFCCSWFTNIKNKQSQERDRFSLSHAHGQFLLYCSSHFIMVFSCFVKECYCVQCVCVCLYLIVSGVCVSERLILNFEICISAVYSRYSQG